MTVGLLGGWFLPVPKVVVFSVKTFSDKSIWRFCALVNLASDLYNSRDFVGHLGTGSEALSRKLSGVVIFPSAGAMIGFSFWNESRGIRLRSKHSFGFLA